MTSPTRACSWGCWSRSASSGAASTPGGRCRSRCPSLRATRPSGSTASSSRYEQEALSRADRLVRFAESRTCRHRRVARHFGETLADDCGMCDVCSPLAPSADTPAAAAPLPEDIAAAIHEAVLGLRWPLGRTGLTAMLRGSMSAPRSAQRSPDFGLLAAASQADVKRWLQLAGAVGCARGVRERGRLQAAAGGAGRARIGGAAAAEHGRRRPLPAAARGGSNGRRPMKCRHTSCSTTRRCARPRDGEAGERPAIWPRSSRPTKLDATATTCSPSSQPPRRGLAEWRLSRRAPPRQALLPPFGLPCTPCGCSAGKIVLGRVAESTSCALLALLAVS